MFKRPARRRFYRLKDPKALDKTLKNRDVYNRPDLKADLIEIPLDVDADLVSSMLTNGNHSPALDLDFPCRLVPSRTPGHYHLYLDGVEMDWSSYRQLLVALHQAKIIEEGFYRAAIDNAQTLLRTHTAPPSDEEDCINELLEIRQATTPATTP